MNDFAILFQWKPFIQDKIGKCTPWYRLQASVRVESVEHCFDDYHIFRDSSQSPCVESFEKSCYISLEVLTPH